MWPAGFRAYTGRGGLREHGDDISIVVSDRPATSAAMFTRSLFAGPAVVNPYRFGRAARAAGGACHVPSMSRIREISLVC